MVDFPYVWLELELNGIDAVPFDRFFWMRGSVSATMVYRFFFRSSCWIYVGCN